MGPDYDDVGAISLLHAYADSGYITILATMASTRYEGVAAVFNIFNTYFQRADLPIGVPGGQALTLHDWQHWTDSLLVRYPHKLKMNQEAMDAVKLYRKILAQQPPGSVTIISTGFLTNLAGLLDSKADRYSPLDGRQLVARKVKMLVCMAGRFPEGYEFNLDQDKAASKIVLQHWPTKILFSGYEIGEKIPVGLPLIHNTALAGSPVKMVFRICIPLAPEDSAGRKSWDETAVMVAVKGYLPYYRLHYGRILFCRDGKDRWLDKGRQQAYLVEAKSPKLVETYLNNAIMH